MKLNPDRMMRAMALLVAVPVIVLCYHKHPFAGGLTDTFIAGVFYAGPLVLCALLPRSWLTARAAFSITYSLSLSISLLILLSVGKGIIADADPAFPNLARGVWLTSVFLVAASVMALKERGLLDKPALVLGAGVLGVIYPFLPVLVAVLVSSKGALFGNLVYPSLEAHQHRFGIEHDSPVFLDFVLNLFFQPHYVGSGGLAGIHQCQRVLV